MKKITNCTKCDGKGFIETVTLVFLPGHIDMWCEYKHGSIYSQEWKHEWCECLLDIENDPRLKENIC